MIMMWKVVRWLETKVGKMERWKGEAAARRLGTGYIQKKSVE